MVKHKTLNSSQDVNEVLLRIGQLEENTIPRWGKMNAAQMLKHCSLVLQTATGEVKLPKTYVIFGLIGRITKYTIWITGIGIPPDMPTYRCLCCLEDCNFEENRQKLVASIKKYNEAAAAGRLRKHHRLFGRMNKKFWGILEYKHLNHHLKQFKV